MLGYLGLGYRWIRDGLISEAVDEHQGGLNHVDCTVCLLGAALLACILASKCCQNIAHLQDAILTKSLHAPHPDWETFLGPSVLHVKAWMKH